LDSLVKERLTGAIILVVLIVLLVPELLSGPSRPAPQAAATSSQEPPLRSYTIDLADESHPATTTAAGAEVPSPPPTIVEPPSATAAQPPTSADASPGASSQAQEGPVQGGAEGAQQLTSPPAGTSSQKHTIDMPAAQPPPQRRLQAPPAQRPDTATAGWMVQLGVFAKHENADRLVQELKEQGFHTLVSESSGGGRPLWRVRAGPLAERAAAEQLSAKLRAAGHAGSVVPK
jgi:DedD protein